MLERKRKEIHPKEKEKTTTRKAQAVEEKEKEGSTDPSFLTFDAAVLFLRKILLLLLRP